MTVSYISIGESSLFAVFCLSISLLAPFQTCKLIAGCCETPDRSLENYQWLFFFFY